MKHGFGYYLGKKMLANSGRMGKEERGEDTLFGLYLWEMKHSKWKNQTGIMSSLSGGLTTNFAGGTVGCPMG
jgi:hypothetical protein